MQNLANIHVYGFHVQTDFAGGKHIEQLATGRTVYLEPGAEAKALPLEPTPAELETYFTGAKAKHTAGPWHVQETELHKGLCVKPCPGQVVADLLDTQTPQDWKNAYLIAAAPELLKAAAKADAYLSQYIGNGMADAGVVKLRDDLRAAVNSARGK